MRNCVLTLICMAVAAGLLGGCKSPATTPKPDYPWHGPLTDATNGIVKPPRW